MNAFDAAIISYLNAWVHHSWTFDTFMVYLSANPLLKGGVITALIWRAWFLPGERQNRNREFLLCTVVASLMGLTLARTLALALPFRVRPFYNPLLHFQLPANMDLSALERWSSFPSDHATLFFSLATGLCFVSRQVGVFALSYILVVVCFPRIYLGIHYPTDIVAGALIGIGIASLAKIPVFRAVVTRPAMRWLNRYPGAFYAVLFLCTFEIAELFDSSRVILRLLTGTLKRTVKIIQ